MPEQSSGSPNSGSNNRTSSSTEAAVDVLLRITPRHLESEFWEAPETQRLLRAGDILAVVMVVQNVLAAMQGRVNKSLPEGTQLPVGAKVILLLYWFLSILPVALMLHRTSYLRFRTPIALLSRAYRLGAAGLLTHPGTVLGTVTQVAAVRSAALAGETWRALLTNSLMPTIFHLQQANCHMSFRLALPFQIGLFGVALIWAQGMPCWLNLLPADSNSSSVSSCVGCSDPSSSGGSDSGVSPYLAQLPLSALQPPAGVWTAVNGSHAAANRAGQHGGIVLDPAAATAAAADAFQRAGVYACSALQVSHTLLWAPMLLQTPERERLCGGILAFQLVFLFTAAVLLLVVVPASIYCVEYYSKLAWLRGKGIAVAREGYGCRLWQLLGRWDLPRYLLFAVPFSLCWVLAEATVQRLGDTCAPLWDSDVFAWMTF